MSSPSRKNARDILCTCACAALAIFFSFSFIGCESEQQPVLSIVTVDEPTVSPAAAAQPTATPVPLVLKSNDPTEGQQSDGGDDPQKHVVVIRAVGDLMMHDRQLRSAKTAQGYDFTQYFAHITDEISTADIAIGNLETPVGTDGFSGFPLFKAPPQYLDVIAQAGFDVLSLANNHMLDQGIAGIGATTEQLRARGLRYTGAGSKEETAAPLLIDQNGIRVAMLSYTQFTNARPTGSEQHVKYLSKDTIARDIALARQDGADFILAFVHWGNEYEQTQSADQIGWARILADAGVDAILGAHPHVLQPIEYIQTADGRKVFCAYSLGNFISNQPDFPRYIGGIAELTIEKDEATKTTTLVQSGFIPTWICRTLRPDTTCDYTVLRADEANALLDEAVAKMADEKAGSALKHAVGVLGKYGAQKLP